MGRLFKFLFGLGIGAGAALLVTPKTGREMRDMLAGPQVRGLMPSRLAELAKPRAEDQFDTGATAVAEPPFAYPQPTPAVEPEPIAEAEPEPVVQAEPEPIAEPEAIAEVEPIAE
ncbi:MAG TPA: hypothetical protein VL117_14815, partial [Thermoleophilia bacterium]|nr:hypothetical protein [Thermoleophilia bacterium]